MRTLQATSSDPWMGGELDAVERGAVVAQCEVGVLVAYERGERRWSPTGT